MNSKLKNLFLILFLCLTEILTYAQVGINTDGSNPHNSAMLDVKSNSKGILPPRMTYSQILDIQSPAEGLFVFCTNCGPTGDGSLAMYMGGKWSLMTSSCMPPASPTQQTHIAGSSQITWNWESVPGAIGYKFNTSNNLQTAISLDTNSFYIETGLDCNTTQTRFLWAYDDCGTSAPVTLSQSTAVNPALPGAGVSLAYPHQITWNWTAAQGATGYKWNTSNNYATAVDVGNTLTKSETGLSCNTVYKRYIWAYNNCGNTNSIPETMSTTISPAAPTTASHVANTSEIIWNWNVVTGATGYKWNTVNNYATAQDMGTSTTKTETGLACNNSFTRYIWAYSNCGNSVAGTITKSTPKFPDAPVAAVTFATPTTIIWNWNAVPGAAGYKWNTTNSYATAQDMGSATSKTEINLNCNTSYTRYVWAYSSCGSSTSVALTQVTPMTNIPLAPVEGTHTFSTSTITWKWLSVSGAIGYKWSTENDYSTAIDMGLLLQKTETGLACATTYNRYVWAYSSCGYSAVTPISQTTIWCLWTCGQPVLDSRDGQEYNTVLINTQCWMAENINIGTRINGSEEQSNNNTIEKYCMNDLESNCTTYGGLYQWDEMMNYATQSSANPSGRQGICPEGWHIPSFNEWCQMETFLDPTMLCSTDDAELGTDAGGKMKETGTLHWLSANTGATNTSGFTALGAGKRNSDGTFMSFNTSTLFWSSSISVVFGFDRTNSIVLNNYSSKISHLQITSKDLGNSVRCIRD
ncbi:MAG: hypothetical protein IPH88_17045 [Bacteroidales bacterium]|nr:hypothetical protein [Bacteroidales bacterium]